MATLKGIKFEKDKKGNTSSLTIDMKKHGDDRLLEDFLDNLAAKEAAKGQFYDYDDAVKKMKKKRGIKDK